MKTINDLQKQLNDNQELRDSVYMNAVASAKKCIDEYMNTLYFKWKVQDYGMQKDIRVQLSMLGFPEDNGFSEFSITFNNNSWTNVKFMNVLNRSEIREGKFELGVEMNLHSRYGTENCDMVANGDTLDRLIALGDIAEIINDNKDRIEWDMREVLRPFHESYRKLYDQGYQLESEISKINLKKKRDEIQNIMNELMTNGIELKSTNGTYPSFEYSSNKRVYNPRFIKILEVSRSGKTATVQFKQQVSTLDDRVDDRCLTMERVKMNRVHNYIDSFKSLFLQEV